MRRRPRKRLKEDDSEEASNICNLCKEGPDEEVFGKYFVDKNSGFSVHQYCLFFASGLAQRGADDEGFDGFLIKDIKKEISRSKRLRCNYCLKQGATIGCCNSTCKQTFHYKCGQQRGALFQYFDSFNSYCLTHRPTQRANWVLSTTHPCPICCCEIELNSKTPFSEIPLVTPCCKRTWFHKSCLQKTAQHSGLYYFRCPVCNDMNKFQAEMKRMGIFIPEQDASWEKDDAFADLLFQYSRCDAKRCICPNGREYKESAGKWRIRLCNMCGQAGTHYKCQHWKKSPAEWCCDVCGSIETHSNTRQRQIGDRSEEVTHSEDEGSSSGEEADVKVDDSDDELSLATIRNRENSIRQSPAHRAIVEKRLREGASPMRKRLRLSSEGTAQITESLSDVKEGCSKTSQNNAATRGLHLDDILDSDTPSSILFALSDTVDDMFVKGLVTSQVSTDIGQQMSKKNVETIVIDDNSDNASDSSVEIVRAEFKTDQTDLKRRPISRHKKNSGLDDDSSSITSESSTTSVKSPGKTKQGVSTRSRVTEIQDDNCSKSSELATWSRSKSPAKGKQTLSLSTRRRSIDVVEADSSAPPIKKEDQVSPTSEVNKTQNDDDDDELCIISVLKNPRPRCPVGNDKIGMKCPLIGCICNSKDYNQPSSSTSPKKAAYKFKDLQSMTVSSTSSTSCDHVKEKSSMDAQQSQLSGTASTATNSEEKGDACSVGTNTLPFKPSLTKKLLSETQTDAHQKSFFKGKIPASSHFGKERLRLRSKKNGRFMEKEPNKSAVPSCNAI